jgi:CheY-like chemotaxis protein
MSAKPTGARILLAEDDVTYGAAVQELLQCEGHAVKRVLDGKDALDELRANGPSYDLLLCDLLLPRCTGFEIVRELLAMDIGLPVLVMTAVYEDMREVHALRGLGVRGYIRKSSPFDHVVFRVNTLLFPSRDEVRGNPRVAISLPVQFRIGERIHYGTSYNLSISGVYVRTPEPMIPGAVTEMALALPTAREMVGVTAEIVHSATVQEVRGTAYPAGFGARFVDLSPLAAAAIKRCVERVRAEELGAGSVEEPVVSEVSS